MGTNPGIISEKQRPTYVQKWPLYNSAQTVEKDRFQELLSDLLAGLPVAPPKIGRPAVPLRDAIFAAAFKVYSTVSARRFMSDLREAHKRGLISRVPCYNSIFNILQNEDITPVLISLIERTALPLSGVEQVHFAVDSSWFPTSRVVNSKSAFKVEVSGVNNSQHDTVKVHIMCGVKTNIVTAIAIGEQNAYDGKFLAPLLETTHKNFNVTEVSADKGYVSRRNFQVVDDFGALPFIKFRDSDTGKGGGIWTKMYHYFQYRREEFDAHYNKRSNVESIFSAIKRKFGPRLRSRTDAALKNELLCRFLCHNIIVLIHEIHELGIMPEFWPENSNTTMEGFRVI